MAELKRACRRCSGWWPNKLALNRATVAVSVVLPRMHCIGTVHLVAVGRPLNQFEGWMVSKCVHAYRMSGHMLAGRYFYLQQPVWAAVFLSVSTEHGIRRAC